MNDPSSDRGWFTGVANIVRFNPRFYGIAVVAIAAIAAALALTGPALTGALVLAAWTGLAAAAWWIAASLLASWWIYDLSGLYRWDWLARRLPSAGRSFAVAHAGFDEVTLSLRARFPDREIVTVDFHDPDRMTEPSIARARRLCPPLPGTLAAGLGPWPLADAPAVLFPLSAHEWRRAEERRALLRSAADALAPAGCLILLEHLRDLRNFLVFGPGFLHFHSESTWRSDAESAGLRCVEVFRVAHFLRGFVFRVNDPAEPIDPEEPPHD